MKEKDVTEKQLRAWRIARGITIVAQALAIAVSAFALIVTLPLWGPFLALSMTVEGISTKNEERRRYEERKKAEEVHYIWTPNLPNCRCVFSAIEEEEEEESL